MNKNIKSLAQFKEKELPKLAIWFYPMNLSLQPVTQREYKWGKSLGPKRLREYLYSRGFMRKSLADLFNINCLNIPLNSPPGESPELEEGLGKVSMSHCSNALVIAWANINIGLDIERIDRCFNYRLLVDKYFLENEKKLFSECNPYESKIKALSLWILKEASIKYQRGRIYKNIRDWEVKGNYVFNKINNKRLNSYQFDFHYWKIGLVMEEKLNCKFPIICVR